MCFENNKPKILVILILIIGQSLYGQTIETEWLACNVYSDTTYVKFENDTVFFKRSNSVTFEEFTEVSSYTIIEDAIFWVDLASIYQCDTSIIGKYIYQINNNELSFKEIEDDCVSRLDVLSVLRLKATIVNTSNPLQKEVKIYPNPVFGNDLFISIEGGGIAKYQYELYDNQGRKRIEGFLINSERVHLERLESGYYYLIVREEKSKKTITYKIQKI